MAAKLEQPQFERVLLRAIGSSRRLGTEGVKLVSDGEDTPVFEPSGAPIHPGS